MREGRKDPLELSVGEESGRDSEPLDLSLECLRKIYMTKTNDIPQRALRDDIM